MTDVLQDHIKSLEQRLAAEAQSPLFARLASYYLQAGRADDALRLCDDGLAMYPFYSTAHLVKGKALVKLGMMAEGKHEFEVVHELLPTNETVARLASGIDSGTPGTLGAPPQEAAPQAEIAAPTPVVEEVVTDEAQPQGTEETLQQEPLVVEEPFVPTETVLVPEPPSEEPQPAAPTEAAAPEEDSFGAQTPPVVVEEQYPPSGYETPDFGVADQLQPTESDTGFGATPEEPVTAPATIEEPEQPVTDYGFGTPEEAPPVEPAAVEVPSVSEPEIAEPLPSVATEDAFGVPSEVMSSPVIVEPTPAAEPPVILTPPVSEPPTAEAPPAKEDQVPDWFEAFSQLQQPTAETSEVPQAAPAEEENPFAMFGAEQTPEAVTSEPYEEFAARIRMELFGTEDTMTLDQYLSASPEPPATTDQFGELAEKLKSSPRITPPVINYSEKAPRPATENEASSGSGFVTPTLAEIYVKQGWFDDAIKAYRALVVNKPAEKEKFEQRIAEIEEMKKK